MNVGGDTGTDVDIIWQHFHLAARCVDIQGADGALAGHSCSGIQIQLFYRRALCNRYGGVDRVFIDGHFFHRAAADVDFGFRCHGDNFVDIAGQIEPRAGFAVDLDILETVPSGRFAFQIGVGADIYFVNISIANRADSDILVGGTVDNHFRGSAVFQNDTAIALVAFASAAGNDFAVYSHVIKRDISQSDAASDIQVAGNGHVFKSDTRAGDHQVACNAG